MADLVIQRVVFPLDPHLSPLYYRILDRASPAEFPDTSALNRRSLVVGRGGRIDTNTYFNGFFEAYWHRHCAVEKIVLRLRVSGKGTVRLFRASAACGTGEIGHVDFDGEGRTLEIEVPTPRGPSRELGMLFFEVVAFSDSVTLLAAEWLAKDVAPKPVQLVAGYCTFDREEFVLRNIRTLAEDTGLADHLSRTIVVDQGTRKVTEHPEFRALPGGALAKTSFFRQANFGGTGGFTRCILEAMRLPGATHVLLLDDDAIVEPESVFRTATFFSLAKEEFAVGGAMLDLLRPTEMYEAGGFVLPWRLGVGGRGRDLSLESADNVLSLADPRYPHYNAWWFFACPLSLVSRLGLPLPLFIRCDDLEFGCRLMRAGIRTISLPGLGVWHQPFYLKKRGWLDYYSRRNVLVAIAIHFSKSRLSLAAAFLGMLTYRLLMLDYFKAWAVCQGMDDYLLGPSLLKQDPARTHQRVLEVHRSLSPGLLPRTESLPVIVVPPVPKSPVRRLCSLIGALLRQLVRSSPGNEVLPDHALSGKDEHWHALRKANVVAIDDPGNDGYVLLRRDRRKFLAFLARGLRTASRLMLVHGRTAKKWRAETRQLTEPRFWHEYLGLTAAESPQASIDLPKGL